MLNKETQDLVDNMTAGYISAITGLKAKVKKRGKVTVPKIKAKIDTSLSDGFNVKFGKLGFPQWVDTLDDLVKTIKERVDINDTDDN